MKATASESTMEAHIFFPLATYCLVFLFSQSKAKVVGTQNYHHDKPMKSKGYLKDVFIELPNISMDMFRTVEVANFQPVPEVKNEIVDPAKFETERRRVVIEGDDDGFLAVDDDEDIAMEVENEISHKQVIF